MSFYQGGVLVMSFCPQSQKIHWPYWSTSGPTALTPPSQVMRVRNNFSEVNGNAAGNLGGKYHRKHGMTKKKKMNTIYNHCPVSVLHYRWRAKRNTNTKATSIYPFTINFSLHFFFMADGTVNTVNTFIFILHIIYLIHWRSPRTPVSHTGLVALRLTGLKSTQPIS